MFTLCMYVCNLNRYAYHTSSHALNLVCFCTLWMGRKKAVLACRFGQDLQPVGNLTSLTMYARSTGLQILYNIAQVANRA